MDSDTQEEAKPVALPRVRLSHEQVERLQKVCDIIAEALEEAEIPLATGMTAMMLLAALQLKDLSEDNRIGATVMCLSVLTGNVDIGDEQGEQLH